MNLTYVVSPKVSVEFEYLQTKDDHGSLEDRHFVWVLGDNNVYKSPDVINTMTWNNLAFNAIVRLGDRPVLTAEMWNPYVTLGGGFYKYHSHVENLVWPGQAFVVEGGESLNAPDPGPSRELIFPPYDDVRHALSFNAGVGLEAFIIKNVSLDVRMRYHLSVGELRPINDYLDADDQGITQTFPLPQWDLGGGIKLYSSR